MISSCRGIVVACQVVAKGEEGEEQDLLSVTLCGASAEDPGSGAEKGR